MKLLLTTVAAMVMATTSFAADIDASVEIGVSEDQTTENFEAEATINLGLTSSNELSFGSLALKATDNGSVAVDAWNIGTTVSGVRVSYGDQGGILPEANAAAGFDTLADTNAAMSESVQLSTNGLSFALGLADVSTDVTDVENVQLSYTAGVLTGAVDYNRTSEEYTYAVAGSTDVAGYSLGGIATFAADVWAYELDTTVAGLTGYLNGDENDTLQHIGVTAGRDFNGIALTSTLDYDTDSGDVSPSVKATFAF